MGDKEKEILVHYELDFLVDKTIKDSYNQLFRRFDCRYRTPEDVQILKDVLTKVFLLGLKQSDEWKRVKMQIYAGKEQR